MRRWRQLSDIYFWDIVLAEAPDEFRADPNSDPDSEWKDTAEVREKLRPGGVSSATSIF